MRGGLSSVTYRSSGGGASDAAVAGVSAGVVELLQVIVNVVIVVCLLLLVLLLGLFSLLLVLVSPSSSVGRLFRLPKVHVYALGQGSPGSLLRTKQMLLEGLLSYNMTSLTAFGPL